MVHHTERYKDDPTTPICSALTLTLTLVELAFAVGLLGNELRVRVRRGLRCRLRVWCTGMVPNPDMVQLWLQAQAQARLQARAQVQAQLLSQLSRIGNYEPWTISPEP